MVAFRLAARLLLLLAAVHTAHADAVVKLSEANFDQLTAATDAERAVPHFVEFFAPWCGHCKKLAPTWAELADKLNADGDATKVAAVDATVDKPLASRFGVRGFPTLLMFAGGKMYKYSGSRDVESLRAFATGGYAQAEGADVPKQGTAMSAQKEQEAGIKMSAAVLRLDEANFDELTAATDAEKATPFFVEFYAPWCGHCKKLAPKYSELADKLKAEQYIAKVGAVDVTSNPMLGMRFGIRGFPTLIMFAGGKLYRYEGGRSLEEMESFVKGGYLQGESEAAPPAPTLVDRIQMALGELFKAIVNLYQTQLPAAMVMTTLALFTGLLVGFACGLIVAPSPKPRPPARPAGDESKKEK